MKKARRDSKGRVLRTGETFRKDVKLYRYSYMTAEGKRKAVYAVDLPELREKEKQILLDSVDGIENYANGGSDINYVFGRYIDLKRNLRSTTETNYRYIYDRLVRESFGKRKIADVRYSDVLQYYQSLLDSGYKIATIDNVHSLLHPTFQMAVRDSVIRSNPSDGVIAELKKQNDIKTSPRRALTYEQECAFLNYVADTPEISHWHPLFMVMFGTGCRVGELIGLRWEDIDLSRKLLDINHNITYYPRHDKDRKSEYRVSLPKTDAGVRIIPMLDKVKEAFLQEKKNQMLKGMCCTDFVDGMDGFIFCNRFGKLQNPSGINRAIKRIISDYNAKEEVEATRQHREPVIIPAFSCHIARHTFCTRLCENETNIKVIQQIMGHKDIQTTMDIYAEVTEAKKKEVFDQLNQRNVL